MFQPIALTIQIILIYKNTRSILEKNIWCGRVKLDPRRLRNYFLPVVRICQCLSVCYLCFEPEKAAGKKARGKPSYSPVSGKAGPSNGLPLRREKNIDKETAVGLCIRFSNMNFLRAVRFQVSSFLYTTIGFRSWKMCILLTLFQTKARSHDGLKLLRKHPCRT